MGQGKSSHKILLGVLGIVVALSGCHKKTPAPRTPVTPAVEPSQPSPPQQPSVNLTAEPATVERGQPVTLSWTSENAAELDLEPGRGKVQATGSVTVSPTESTTYVLTAKGPGGTQTGSARVTVTSPPSPAPSSSEISAPPRPGIDEENVVDRELKDAHFDLDKSDIRPDAQQILTGDAEVLKANTNSNFVLEGHCDERGSEEYNLGLGDRRATAAKSFLVNLGVPADRITTISYGKDHPQCNESSEECWQKNRRAHFARK